MQGRQGQNKEPWDKSSTSQHLAAINGTGRQRAIPQRPPNMARIQNPPVTPRVGRPQREAAHPRNLRRLFLIWGVVFIVCSLLACVIGYAAVNFFSATNATAGSAVVATNFLSSLKSQDYTQAYNDLSAGITVQASPSDFTQEAQTVDRCYGPVTDYNEIANSAVQINAQSYSYSYNITRSKVPHPYTLRLTVQQDNEGNWKINSYGNNNNLGPGNPPCA